MLNSGLLLLSGRKQPRFQLSKGQSSAKRFLAVASEANNAASNAIQQKLKDVWYRDGLKFKCTGCGKCCTGASGWVWISDEDMDNISKHLKIPKAQFVEEYTEYVPEKQRYTLKERIVQATPMDPDRETEFECIFLNGKMCSIYEHRPQQCRTFPWWPDVVRSKTSWENEKERCEGLDHPEADVTPALTIFETTSAERASNARKRRAKLKF